MVDLDETVLGVLLLERQGGMESHMIQAWDTFQAHAYGTALAGNYRWHMLNNPVGSGRIAVIDWYRRDTSANMKVFMTLGITPGMGVVHTGYPVDTRIPNSRQAACDLYQLAVGSASIGTQIGEVSSAEEQDFRIVLGEDGSVLWRSGAQNEAVGLTVRWAERDAAPFEK